LTFDFFYEFSLSKTVLFEFSLSKTILLDCFTKI